MTARIPVATTLIKALGWSLLSAIAVSFGGFFGHRMGTTMYPQRYEGMPSDLFFIPLGLTLGIVVAVMARLSRPMWRAMQMLAMIALASVGYGGLLYQYARTHALPAGFTISFEPDPGDAVRCGAGATCPEASPPLEWSVEGSIRVTASNGLGATVDSISLASFSGPNLRLEGRQIPGPRRIRGFDVVSYPVRYYYRTRSGSAERDIRVHIDFTDITGHWVGAQGLWKVR